MMLLTLVCPPYTAWILSMPASAVWPCLTRPLIKYHAIFLWRYLEKIVAAFLPPTPNSYSCQRSWRLPSVGMRVASIIARLPPTWAATPPWFCWFVAAVARTAKLLVGRIASRRTFQFTTPKLCSVLIFNPVITLFNSIFSCLNANRLDCIPVSWFR